MHTVHRRERAPSTNWAWVPGFSAFFWTKLWGDFVPCAPPTINASADVPQKGYPIADSLSMQGFYLVQYGICSEFIQRALSPMAVAPSPRAFVLPIRQCPAGKSVSMFHNSGHTRTRASPPVSRARAPAVHFHDGIPDEWPSTRLLLHREKER